MDISDNQQLTVQFIVSCRETIHIFWKFRDLVEYTLNIITNHYFPL